MTELRSSGKARPRKVTPRKLALLTASSLAAAAPLAVPALTAGAVLHATATHASEAGEGGEAGQAVKATESGEAGKSGEAGITQDAGPSGYLTRLGYFEGTYLIVADLYLGGARDLAKEHLEQSHHAVYQDIEGELEAVGAPGFEAAAAAFSAAVRNGAPDAEVSAALDALMARIAAARAAANPSLHDRLISIRDLLTLAHAEYEGGVDEGRVETPIEYRDSWGFYQAARHRAAALAADPATAAAGAQVLERMAGLDLLYPGLTADTAATDPAPLAAAAGWVEIIALRNK